MMIMSQTNRSQIEIPPEIEREMTPAVRDFFERMSAFWQSRLNECEARIAELEREVKHLRNPHDPKLGKPAPKSDAGTASTKPNADPPKRRRGGQPGHPKSARPLIPTAQCQAVVELVPDACRRCGEELAGWDPNPLRHQVYELPIIEPMVTEYQLHRLDCACCNSQLRTLLRGPKRQKVSATVCDRIHTTISAHAITSVTHPAFRRQQRYCTLQRILG